MMRLMGLDLDGVLYEWHTSVYDYCVRFRDYTKSITEFWTNPYESCDMDFWNTITEVDIFYSNMSPTPDCVKFLDVVKEKFELYYITSRPDYVKTTTQQYLRRYGFPYQDNLIFTKDKVNMARKLQLSYIILDNVENVKSLSNVTNTILRARPWNKEIWDLYPTCHSLMDALQFIDLEDS